MPGLTRSQKMAITKTELKVFAGYKGGRRIIAAVSNVTEFRRITKLDRLLVEGVTTDLAERSFAMAQPRIALSRPQTDRTANFVRHDRVV